MTADSVQAVLRLRTLGPSGLNPPQTAVIDRLQTLTEDGPIADLDIDIWGPSMGITQDDCDPEGARETVAEFKQWADEQGCTLRPAFEWRSAESAADGEGRIVTPLITLAVYDDSGERLQAVYPHVDGDEVWTIHDGLEALESMAGTRDAEQSGDETNENRAVSLP
jgi:hypothetical protein